MSVAFILIFLLAPWRLWVAILYFPFARSFPRLAFKYSLALTAYSLFALAVFQHVPVLLPLLAVAALGAMARDLWRARPAFGRSRHLPAGSIAPLNMRVFADQDFYRKTAARLGPIFKASWFTSPVVCVVGLERGMELLRRAGNDLGTTRYPFGRFVPGGFLRSLDPAPHAKYREAMQEIFSPAVIRECEPEMAEIFRDSLRVAAAECERCPREGVRVRLHLNRMLFAAWVRLFYGIAPDSPMAVRLKALYRIVDLRNPYFLPDRKISQAMREIIEFAAGQLESLKSQNERGAGGKSCFLAQLLRAKPEVAQDPTVLGNLVMLFHTSWSDVAGLSQWLVKMLGDNPAWIARLRDAQETAPAGEVRRDLAECVVLETLRLEQSELLHRRAKADIPIEGFVIPRGWLVRICVGESHRLASVFDEPDLFNPDRFRNREYARTEYAPFGTTPYACLGAAVTITAGRLLVTELSCNFQWAVVSDGPPEFGPWCHWRPSSRFRISVRAGR